MEHIDIEPHAPSGFKLPWRAAQKVDDTKSHISNRMPLLNFLPGSFRNHFIAMMGEFAGTFMFLFFAFAGTEVANTVGPTTPTDTGADTSRLLYISLCFGFSLAVNAWVFFRISGGLFNPAVTLGMCLVGAVPYIRGCLVVVSQILGAITAAAVILVLFPGGANIRTALGGGTSVVQGLFIEMFLTAQLVFTIFMLAAEKHKATFIAPIGIGLSLFIAELTGVYFTGGSVNPARTFGPCVALHSFHSYHWIYWVGPILGSLVASGFYKLIKAIEYETANPGQDFDDKEATSFNPDGVQDTSNPQQNATATPNFVVDAAPQKYYSKDGALKPGATKIDSAAPTVPAPLGHHLQSAVRDARAETPLVNYVDQPAAANNGYAHGPDAESGRIAANGVARA